MSTTKKYTVVVSFLDNVETGCILVAEEIDDKSKIVNELRGQEAFDLYEKMLEGEK